MDAICRSAASSTPILGLLTAQGIKGICKYHSPIGYYVMTILKVLTYLKYLHVNSQCIGHGSNLSFKDFIYSFKVQQSYLDFYNCRDKKVT